MAKTKRPNLVAAAAMRRDPTPQPVTPPAAGQGSRANKTNVTGYFSHEVKEQIRILGAKRRQTTQRMLAEALNDFFAKNGMPELAPLDE
jgi:hypothetical protein